MCSNQVRDSTKYFKNKILETEGWKGGWWVVGGWSVNADFMAHSGSEFQLSIRVRAKCGIILCSNFLLFFQGNSK